MSLLLPVRYPVKHYSHLDAGAPQMSDVNGAIKTILKACMVTGYGDKAGAGWTALFDDAFRVVLRRPLRTGNPPDIKIENGISSRHQIISQDNPTSINDTKKLANVNLLARDTSFGLEWHLIVTDFGFVFCYQMGVQDYGNAYPHNHMLYCGSVQKIVEANSDFFVSTTSDQILLNGKGAAFVYPLLDSTSLVKDMRTNTIYRDFYYIELDTPELYINGDYSSQSLILAKRGLMPFYCALSNKFDDLATSTIAVDNRPMLRYANDMYNDISQRAFYIPLDYWEL